ncbi:hypothetical protein RB195_001491 [Necator americanus]|uniref:Uncharacterized protein n=1 Tax=Necator americanus TaxID=51031 RepID=A0ABR1DEI6_NECAM
MKELLALARPVRRSTGVKVNKVTIHGMATDADLHVLLGPRERMKFNMIALRETKSRRSGVRQMNVGTLVIRREGESLRQLRNECYTVSASQCKCGRIVFEDISQLLRSMYNYYTALPPPAHHNRWEAGNFVIRVSRTYHEYGEGPEVRTEKSMREAWATFARIKEARDQLTDQELRDHLFDLTALHYIAKTIVCLRDAAEHTSKAKHRWAGNIMRRIKEAERRSQKNGRVNPKRNIFNDILDGEGTKRMEKMLGPARPVRRAISAKADMSIDLQMAYIYTVINGHPYPPLYDCSNRTTEEWYATGSEEWPLGIYFLVTGVLLEILYLPCLATMWKLNLLTSSCYKIMFFLGCLDMSSVFVNSIMTGYFAIRGAVFCTNPLTLLSLGAFGCGFVCVIYLTVNRTIRRGVIDLLVPKKYVGRVHAKLAPTTRASDNRTHSDAHLT